MLCAVAAHMQYMIHFLQFDTLFFLYVGHFLEAVLNAKAGSLLSSVCLVTTVLVCLLTLILPLKSVHPCLYSKATFVHSSPPGL